MKNIKNKVTKVTVVSSVMFLCAGMMLSGEAFGVIKGVKNNGTKAIEKTRSIKATTVDRSIINVFEINPKLSINGAFANKLIGEGEILYPINYDSEAALFAVANVGGTYGVSSPRGGLGLLYRRVIGSNIYGGYLTGNYVRSEFSSKGYFVANPGLELLGNRFDVRVNGYVPVNSKKWANEGEYWACEVGIYEYTTFVQHSEYDRKVTARVYEEMRRGLDFEVGYRIPGLDDLKIFVGGYHFDSRDIGSTNGIDGRIQYKANDKVSYEVSGSYDKETKKAYVGASIRLNFGGVKGVDSKDIRSRLADPIERDLFDISLSNMNRVDPLTKRNYIVGTESLLEHDNVWFFSPAETSTKDAPTVVGDGTYEHPFVGITSTIVDMVTTGKSTLGEYPLLYFASGTYNFNEFQVKRFSLPVGWGMYGRDNDYRAPAFDDRRPLFDVGNGGLIITGTTGNTAMNELESISILKSQYLNGDESAVELSNANLVLRNDSIIDSVTVDRIGATMFGWLCGMKAANSNVYFNVLAGDKFNSNLIESFMHVKGWDADQYDVRSVGVKMENSHLTFVNGVNYISAYMRLEGTVGLVTAGVVGAYGVYDHYVDAQSNGGIDFQGGNNEIISNTYDVMNGYTPSVHSYSEGIHSDYTSGTGLIVFSGGVNKVDVDIHVKHPHKDLISLGVNLYGNGSSITFLAGDNTVDARSEDDEASTFPLNNETGGVYGSTGVKMIFSGGRNSILVNSEAVGINLAKGIKLDYRGCLSFLGGSNFINVIARGEASGTNLGTAMAYGIYAITASTVNFTGGDTRIHVDGIGDLNSKNSSAVASGLLAEAYSTVTFGEKADVMFDVEANVNEESDESEVIGLDLFDHSKAYFEQTTGGIEPVYILLNAHGKKGWGLYMDNNSDVYMKDKSGSTVVTHDNVESTFLKSYLDIESVGEVSKDSKKVAKEKSADVIDWSVDW